MHVKKKLLSFFLAITILATLFTGTLNVSANEPNPPEEYTPGENMVKNGDFETDSDEDGIPDFWVLNNPKGKQASMTIERDPSKVYQGNGCLKFTVESNANDDNVTVTESEFHAVDPSKTYIIELYGRAPSGVIQVFVEEKETADGPITAKEMIGIHVDQWGDPVWNKITTEYTPSAGVSYARLQFHNWNPIALEAYVDNVVFKEKLEPVIISIDQDVQNVITDIDDMNFTVSGKVECKAGTLNSLKVNDYEVAVQSDGTFNTTVALNRGSNPITITAKDSNGNEASKTIFATANLEPFVTSDDIIAADRENMVVYPHFGTPVFVEPGQTFTAEVAATDVSTSGWTAWIENDLKRWDCTVGEVEYGEGNIYLGMRTGYTIEITVPEDASPELCNLVLTHTESGKTFSSPLSVSIVPELETSFYTLGVTDTHFYYYEDSQNRVSGGNDGKSMGLVAKAATLAGVRFISHTGDVHLGGAHSRAVGIKDFFIEPVAQMGRVPLIFAPGNHEFDLYVHPAPSITEGDRTGDFTREDCDRYFGMRSQIIGMGSFAVIKNDYGSYWGDRDLRLAMSNKWNSVFGEGSPYTYRLLMQHTHNESTALFFNGNEPPPIAPYPSLELKGHNHYIRVDSTNPFLILSLGGWESYRHGQGVLFNFNVDENSNWSCPQATSSFGVNDRVHMVKDARKGYDITYLRDSYLRANNGTAFTNTCTITNEINFNFYDGRVRFEMAQGRYKVTGGTILSQYDYEDERGLHTAVLVDVDIAANAVTEVSIEPDSEIPAEEENMVKNGNFETDADADGIPDFWVLNNPNGKAASMTIERDPSKVYEGEGCLKFTVESNANDDNVTVTESEFHAVDPSKTYIIELYGWAPSGVIQVFVEEKKTADGPITAKEMIGIHVDQWGDPVWNKIATEYTPSEGVSFARLQFHNWNPIALESYVDNVVFKQKPAISIDQQSFTTIHGKDQQLFTVSGVVSVRNRTSFKVNGTDVSVDANGRFSTQVALNVGENTITITAEDSNGNVYTKTIVALLILDRAPIISLDQEDCIVIEGTENTEYVISGTVVDNDGDLKSLKINGDDVEFDQQGKFSTSVFLQLGLNTISVVAVDENDNETVKTITVMLREDQPYDIGVFYFSSWNPIFAPYRIASNKAVYGNDSDWFGGPRDHITVPGPWGYGPVPDREPLLGWYDDYKQETIDTHILQAASRGIDHFSFYYYWKENGGGPRPGQNIELFRKSQYKNLMSYFLYYVADGSYGMKEWKDNIVPTLISYLKDPNYKKTADGRPIIGFFGDMEGRLGGSTASLKEGLDYLRSECQKEGVGNPLLLYDGYRTLDLFIAQGYDGFLPLNLAGIGLDDNKGIPEDYGTCYPDAWEEFVYADYSNDPQYQNYENYLFIPGALNAYDVRPWRASSGSRVENYIYADPSPEKFRLLLDKVKAYLDSHPRSMNMATFYAWNEWGEGGSIEPNTLFGYGYIDVLQEVFGLKNTNYKLVVEDNELTDIAPDVRIRVEPEYSVVTDGQNVKLKVRIKNYSDSEVSGNLTLDANGWTIAESTGTSFTLESGEAADAEFNVTAGAGEYWTKHYFVVTASYGDETQDISTFVVKATPFHTVIENDAINKYDEYEFGINVKVRNYTLDPKTVDYTLELPEGWTADIPSRSVPLNGYSGGGLHLGRTVTDTITITYPKTVEPGKYSIKLISTDGEFNREETFEVDIAELNNLLYNGSFEIDEDNNGIPDVWSPGYSGGEITVIEGTPENPAPKGEKYVRVDVSIPADGEGGYVESGIKQEGQKADVNWLIIDPARKYELSFWAKVEKGTLRVCDTEVSGVYYENLGPYNSSLVITAEENGNEWKHYSFTFFPHPHAGRISVRFHVEGEPGEEITFYLDGVALKEVELTPEESMIVNGGMEDDNDANSIADGWSGEKTGGTFSLLHDWQDQYGAIRSQKISGINAAGSCFKQEWFDIDPAKEYVVEFWARVASGTFAVVSAEKAGDDGEIVYNTEMEFSADTWQKYTYTFRPKEGMTKQSLRFVIKSNEASTAWIDNVVMRPKASEPDEGNPPVITLDQEDCTVTQASFTVSGTVTDEDGDLETVTVNGEEVGVDEEGKFSVVVSLKSGENTITVVATDSGGNTAGKTIKVTYNKPSGPIVPPVIPPSSQTEEESITRNGNINEIDNKVEEGKTSADLSDSTPEDIFDGAGEDDNGIQVVKYVFKNTENVDEYSIKLPAEALNDSTAEKKIIIETGLGTIELPSNMLSNADDATGDFEITLKKVDSSGLSDEIKAIVGDRPVIELSIRINGQNVDWANDGANVIVSLNYKPSEDEMSGSGDIIAYYIYDGGNIIPITLSMYDEETGTVKFITNHFSMFAVGYASRTFDDLGKFEWARKE
ncbi:MAG TPA: hypothetical protein GXX36_04570, partial [Clostridiaceae bacterium]|nr:hypothetical protein [Clostridiaceae bacterium]